MGAQIREIKPAKRVVEVGLHSHIRGLGLDEKGDPITVADGLVGQIEARRSAAVVVGLVKQGKFQGKGVLLVGPPGTGKTALAYAMARELGEDTPFVTLHASEVYSLEAKKTEVLMRAVRKAIGIRIRETRRVYEGAIKEIKIAYGKHPFNPYLKIPKESKITLETKDDNLTLTVGEEITSQLLKLGIKRGDLIWIDAETGVVHKVGRVKGIEKAKYYDVDVWEVSEELPGGSVKKEKEITRVFTFNDLDVAVASQRISLIGFLGVELEREIDEEIRRTVNLQVKKLIDEGRGELIPGVLFIDDVHMLDLECYAFLSKIMESEFAPIIIMATNRGITKIYGTDIESPHGVPLDILDRLLIIPMRPYTREEIREIVKIRSEEEEVALTSDALEALTDLGVRYSLRYAIQILRPASIVASKKGRSEVKAEDVEEVSKLFIDTRRSIEFIREFEEKLLK
ncbi:MAG: RuvB-like domain-containing protein [Sulfolobales archaeon]|nr:RuvB-like domain-containing protein [Sulfolobales archaeon]